MNEISMSSLIAQAVIRKMLIEGSGFSSAKAAKMLRWIDEYWQNKDESKVFSRKILYDAINCGCFHYWALDLEAKIVASDEAKINKMARIVLVAMLIDRNGRFSSPKAEALAWRAKKFCPKDTDEFIRIICHDAIDYACGAVDEKDKGINPGVAKINEIAYTVLVAMLIDRKGRFFSQNAGTMADVAKGVLLIREETHELLRKILLDAIDRAFFSEKD